MNNDIRKYINIVEKNLLQEKHYTASLYHSTNLNFTYNIVKTGTFKLKSIKQDIDKDPDLVAKKQLEYKRIKNKGYNYFLSTSRDKLNSYKKNENEDDLYVTLILDTSFYKNNYIITPFNYFNNHYRDEAEERIWSKSKHIPAKILEIHILVEYIDDYNDFENIENILIKSNIPCYFYDENRDYLLLNKKYAETNLDDYFEEYNK